MSAYADPNRFEAEQRGEFGIGSAAQFGSADLKKVVHVNENFRRANFIAADTSQILVVPHSMVLILKKLLLIEQIPLSFAGADSIDTLMDRMVLNETNLTNAVLVRSVLTRSDLGGAVIEGADFSDAVIDLPQKQALCKYASGTNPITGASTRKREPFLPYCSAPPPKLLDRDGFCDDTTGITQ